jgi:hypothetical protein
MFRINGQEYDLEGSLSRLRYLQSTSKKDWWNDLKDCTEGVGDNMEPKLQCNHCPKKLTVSNPAQSASNHLTVRGCKGFRRLAAAAGDAAAAGASDGGGRSGSTGGAAAAAAAGARPSAPMQLGVGAMLGKRRRSCMYATAEQQEGFEKSMARFFFNNGIPLQQLTEDVDLRAAVAHVGLLPSTRAELANKRLDEEYARVRAADDVKLAGSKLLQLTTDGWRRIAKAAVQGVPLINAMALLPAGGSVFFKVVAAPGVVKDKQWIADRHLEWANLVTEGQLNRLLGMVMDNTKANM